jgi:general stress protein YciG
MTISMPPPVPQGRKGFKGHDPKRLADIGAGGGFRMNRPEQAPENISKPQFGAQSAKKM